MLLLMLTVCAAASGRNTASEPSTYSTPDFGDTNDVTYDEVDLDPAASKGINIHAPVAFLCSQPGLCKIYDLPSCVSESFRLVKRVSISFIYFVVFLRCSKYTRCMLLLCT